MHRFVRRAPLVAEPVTPPATEQRVGQPLSQGAIFTMLATVASDHLSPEAMAVLDEIDPEAWYPGQLLETLINELEDRDPTLSLFAGRGIYQMFRPLLQQFGVKTAEEALRALPSFYLMGTRGDGGEFRVEILGPGRARVEAEQPHNCHFEEGGLIGYLEGMDAEEVRVEHSPSQCMRRGAPFCVMNISWREGSEL